MSEYLDWKVGDKICCINDDDDPQGKAVKIIKNKVYSISETQFAHSRFTNTETILLEVMEVGGLYDAIRFRKVQKRKTDISVFQAMLTKTPAQNKRELENV